MVNQNSRQAFFSRFGISFGFSLLIHGIVMVLLYNFPLTQQTPQFTEVVVVFDDFAPVPDLVIGPDALEEEPEPEPPVVLPPEPEALAAPLEDSPPAPVEPTPPAPVVQTPAPQPPAPQPAAPARVQPAPAPQSTMPSDEDLLADVADLRPRPPSASAPAPSSLPDLSAAIDISRPDSAAAVERFREETQVAPTIAQPSPPEQSQPAAPQTSTLDQQLRQLREQMESQFTRQITPAQASSSTQGFTDQRIQGAAGGRGLVSPNRLDLTPYLPSSVNPAWPNELQIHFQVNEAGFVRVLNEGSFSLYADLHQAVLRLFVDGGQIFVPAPGVPEQRGSITYRLRQ